MASGRRRCKAIGLIACQAPGSRQVTQCQSPSLARSAVDAWGRCGVVEGGDRQGAVECSMQEMEGAGKARAALDAAESAARRRRTDF
jgi:hypothetical protein